MTNKQEPIYSREYSTMELIVKLQRGEDTTDYYEKVRQEQSAISEQLNAKARDEARYENKRSS